MVIKAWGPLVALLVLFGASLFGLLVVEHQEPHNRGQPAVTPYRNRPESKRITAATSNENDDKGKQESNWYDKPTDWLLALFTGILALYTRRLYQATAGLFKETAELRRIADEQRANLLRSIIAAENSAEAAKESADAAIDALTGERAWMLFSQVMTTNFANATIGIENNVSGIFFHIVWKNFGRSPALSIEVAMHPQVCQINSPPPKFEAKFDKSVQRTLPIAPGANANTAKFPVFSSQYDEFIQRKVKVIFYSCIEYRDIYRDLIIYLENPRFVLKLFMTGRLLTKIRE